MKITKKVSIISGLLLLAIIAAATIYFINLEKGPSAAQPVNVSQSAAGNTSLSELELIMQDLNLDNTYFPSINDAPAVFQASWAKEYRNLSDLYNSADDVIIADVSGITEEYESGHVPYTKTGITIVRSLKGALEEGNTETVIETGSVANNFSIDGVPLLRQNMKVILFVRISEYGNLVILNDYAGKYFIDKDAKVSFSGNFTKSDHIDLKVIGDDTSLDDFLKTISDVKTGM